LEERGVTLGRLKATAFALALVLPVGAAAQEAGAPAAPAPDKSGFTLFSPTPDADLRSLCTDRPTKSTSPCTVDAGHFQIESDIVNVTVDRSGGLTTTTTWLATNPTLKLGVTNTVDVELNMAPWEIVTVRDRASGLSSRASGVGDLFARLKWRLAGDDSGAVGFALEPYVKLPTAGASIGNGAVEEGMVAPLNINLPKGWSVVVDPEVDILENAAGDGRHMNTSGLVSVSRGVTKSITLSAEIWTDVDFDPLATVTQVSADLGAAWIPPGAPTLQFDCGVNLGLNHNTPGLQAYVGVSRRF
jgi:hypothetical protein